MHAAVLGYTQSAARIYIYRKAMLERDLSLRENKSILQFLGKNLQEENIKLNFHRNFCVPKDEIKNLKDVAGNPIEIYQRKR